MTQAQARYDVSFGDVSDAQIVIGDHTTVVTPDGVKVVRLVGDARPRLRETPAGARPAIGRPLIGRESELELARRARSGWPLQLLGREGSGKTTLVKQAAAEAPAEPVIYDVARRRSLDDLQAMLFRSFWESEQRFVPAPDEMSGYLADREALVVLDDLELDRDDLAVLLATAPRCTFVVASLTRSLWETGAAHELHGLDPDESLELIEQELGRKLMDGERATAKDLAVRCGGHPQSLVEAAAAVLDRRVSLDPTQRRLLDVLGSLSGAALGTEHIGAAAGVSDPGAALAELERMGLVKSQSPRYRLARPAEAEADEAPIAPVAQHLAQWARRPGTLPEDVAAESEAVEGALEHALAHGRPDLALELAQATEGKLATSGLLGSWQRVLAEGLSAVRASSSGLPADEAYMLHQLGSRAIGVHGDRAREYLLQALDIRERLGDEPGAALTRHNLAQLGAQSGHGNGRPRRGWRLWGLLLLLFLGAGLAVLAAGGSDGRHRVSAVAPTPPRGHRPTITIAWPLNNARFYEGANIRANYDCTPAPDAQMAICRGRVGGVAAPNGSLLPSTVGSHELVVRAVDRRHRRNRKRSRYVVKAKFVPAAPTTVTTPTETPPPTKTTPTPTPTPPPTTCGEGHSCPPSGPG
jgi:hypothetical protein